MSLQFSIAGEQKASKFPACTYQLPTWGAKWWRAERGGILMHKPQHASKNCFRNGDRAHSRAWCPLNVKVSDERRAGWVSKDRRDTGMWSSLWFYLKPSFHLAVLRWEAPRSRGVWCCLAWDFWGFCSMTHCCVGILYLLNQLPTAQLLSIFQSLIAILSTPIYFILVDFLFKRNSHILVWCIFTRDETWDDVCLQPVISKL